MHSCDEEARAGQGVTAYCAAHLAIECPGRRLSRRLPRHRREALQAVAQSEWTRRPLDLADAGSGVHSSSIAPVEAHVASEDGFLPGRGHRSKWETCGTSVGGPSHAMVRRSPPLAELLGRRPGHVVAGQGDPPLDSAGAMSLRTVRRTHVDSAEPPGQSIHPPRQVPEPLRVADCSNPPRSRRRSSGNGAMRNADCRTRTRAARVDPVIAGAQSIGS